MAEFNRILKSAWLNEVQQVGITDVCESQMTNNEINNANEVTPTWVSLLIGDKFMIEGPE